MTVINHIDPPRYPKLITPIERVMKLKFIATVNLIKIDVTKQLVKVMKQ